jgi:glycosyltransferase involved in cell wall biosynthesis
MNVVIDIDGRYDRTLDGSVWVKSGCLYDYWARFLEVFDGVRLVARVREVPRVSPDMQRVDGEGVTFHPIPHYIGPWQYLMKLQQIKHAARSAVNWGDAVVLCAGPISGIIRTKLKPLGYPFAVRVIGDPRGTFAPSSVVHPLRPFFRWWSPRLLRKLCDEATACIYVTESSLQKHYPCPAYSVGVSDVDLPAEAFAAEPRTYRSDKRRIRIVTVGTLAQLYKAPDVLIDAVANCVQGGLDLELVVCGDGKHLPELKTRVGALGLDGRVRFRGELSRDEVRYELDKADLFILPSRQEGLPRAMVEAMARGLPCIGTTVGGIPELLPSDDLIPPNDRAALAAKIMEIVSDPQRMSVMSRRNLAKAAQYREDLLRARWIAFYRRFREITEEWLKTNRR